MAGARITGRNAREVQRLLQSPGMQRAVEHAAQTIAGQVSAALPSASATDRRGRRVPGYAGLAVRVEVTPNGGVRRDRAMATVVVPPPPRQDLAPTDVALRFDVLVRVAREVTR